MYSSLAIEAMCLVGLVKTNILGWVYWWDRRDNVRPLRQKEGDIRILHLRSVGMYVCDFAGGGGGGGNAALQKHSEQDYVISNQQLVCKFEEMGWGMFLRKF